MLQRAVPLPFMNIKLYECIFAVDGCNLSEILQDFTWVPQTWSASGNDVSLEYWV